MAGGVRRPRPCYRHRQNFAYRIFGSRHARLLIACGAALCIAVVPAYLVVNSRFGLRQPDGVGELQPGFYVFAAPHRVDLMWVKCCPRARAAEDLQPVPQQLDCRAWGNPIAIVALSGLANAG